MTGLLRIDKPGLLTLVQDAGRQGMQYAGIPVGGPLDRRSAALVNTLLQNPEDTPVLEITLIGPQITFLQNCQLAICGADLSPSIDGLAISANCTVSVQAGAVLRFGKALSGCRAYLGVRGVWIHPHWGQSVAPIPSLPDLLTESQLTKGQILHILPLSEVYFREKEPIPMPVGESIVRVLPGPELERCRPRAIADFFGKVHRVSPESNRMGYRLQQPLAGFSSEAQILSSGILPGTIQVPPSGIPIILLADAQTIGGYFRIARVVGDDLDIFGQLKPGDALKFMLADE